MCHCCNSNVAAANLRLSDSVRVFDHWGLLPHYAKAFELNWLMGWQDGTEGAGTRGGIGLPLS